MIFIRTPLLIGGYKIFIMDEIEKLKTAKALEAESWQDSKNMSRLWIEVITILEDVLKHNPENVIALTNLGAIYSNFSKYNDALELLKKAVALNFEDKNLYFNLGVVSIGLMREKEASEYFIASSKMESHELTFSAYIDFQAI